ncbi:hypothetical protein Tco_0974436 [Tanacetum coccineum]|uniref:Uncharacterized protein n=1 Tax=Tanacetum coccineum TaxID=301880 RepID=A0ABQ5EBL1_9ASTR
MICVFTHIKPVLVLVYVIANGMTQGLEAGVVHGRKGTHINSIPVYDLDAAEVYADALIALNNVPFPLLEQLEVFAEEKISYIKALLVMGVDEPKEDEVEALLNLASGVTVKESTLVEEVKTIDSDVNTLIGTVSEVAIVIPSIAVLGNPSPFGDSFCILIVAFVLRNVVSGF